MSDAQDQEAADLNALVSQMGVIKQGILDLEAQVAAAGGVQPNVQAALDSLKAAVADTQASEPQPPPPSA